MAHEEAMYANPEEFNPDRFLNSTARDPRSYVFGFGRRFVSIIGFQERHSLTSGFRVCPGRYLADASIWIAIASILATFHISKARDENGVEITPPSKFESGIVR